MSTTTVKGLSVETYDKMVRKGILPESNRFELIEGKLVEKMTKGSRHFSSSGRSWRAIHALLPAGWHVRIEGPVRIPGRRSEPEPDIAVARGAVEDYDDRHPGSEDVALVVEITRSSVAKDRRLARVYGPGGIPVYWIVNLPKRRLEVYANPVGGQYPPPAIKGETESVDLVIDGRVLGRIAVADLLPKRVPGC